MAPIPLKRLVSVTSEDPMNPASNLLSINSTPGKKWLCSNQNKSRKSEVILELAKRSKITAIEIGNFGSAFCEVQVSNTEHASEDYTTLLPSSMLMSIVESKSGRGKTTILKCGRDKLSKSAVDKKWNLVKITVSQKFNLKEQFGLQFISIQNDNPSSQTPHMHTSHTVTPAHTPHTPSTPSSRFRLPSLPTSKHSTEHAQKLKNGTPKRPQRDNVEEEEDYEFAGIERQSRLFKNCVKGGAANDTKPEENAILNRIKSDKKKYSDKLNFDMTYQRAKLLKKEIPKAEGMMDFAESFKYGEAKKSLVLSSMAAYDDESEIGEESKESWGWRKRRGKKQHPRSVAPRGWLKKRKKIDKLIEACDTLVNGKKLGKENHPLKMADIEADVDKKLAHIVEVDSDATVSYDCSDVEEVECVKELTKGAVAREETPTVRGVEGVCLVECPMCGLMLPGYAIEVHASTCGEDLDNVGSTRAPICID